MTDIPLIVAFVAGFVSFLSPCVLPIIPGFLAYLAGDTSAEEGGGSTFVSSVFFVLGFSVVFALLGVLLNTVFEAIAYDVTEWLSRIGGVIIIFFGLYLTGLFSISFLEREHTLFKGKRFKSRHLTSFVFGAAFAAGWTPCVGAALGAILGLAASNPGTAFYLLLAYAVGLGVPFLLTGLFASRAQTFFSRHTRALGYITKVFGVILIVIGILVFTQTLSVVANFGFINSLVL